MQSALTDLDKQLIKKNCRSLTWSTRKRWSDQFLNEIKSILGVIFIGEITKEDQENNTDLVVLELGVVRVACRIRQYRYWQEYADEFTIRARVRTGADTELQKIIMGKGADYFFYGFADESDTRLFSWWVGDLKVFRLWWSRQLCVLPAHSTPGHWKKNADGKSDFLVFKISELPDDFIKYSNDDALLVKVPNLVALDRIASRADLPSPYIEQQLLF